MVKHVASFRQYQSAYAGGHLYVWNVIFGLEVGVGGRGFGVVRLEHASTIKERERGAVSKWCLDLVYLEYLYYKGNVYA